MVSMRRFISVFTMGAIFFSGILLSLIVSVPTTYAQEDEKYNFPTMDSAESAYDHCQQTGSLSMECWRKTGFLLDMASIANTTGGSKDSAISGFGRAIAFMYRTPPAGVGQYVQDLAQHSKFAPPAYAQSVGGVGFASLTPILPIWKTFLNVAYGFYALFFVVIGFAIIFRQKLGGQAVMTVATAIPRVVVSLIIVTFSYAIAGLIVDLMYVTMYLFVGIFSGLMNNPKIGGVEVSLTEIAFSQSIFAIGWGAVWNGGGTNGSMIQTIGSGVGDMVDGVLSGPEVIKWFSSALSLTSNILMNVVLSIALLFVVIQTWFELVKSYVGFLVSLIFSPIELALNTLLEQGGGFMQWIKNMIGRLLPFPVVLVMLLLAMTLGGFGKGDIGYQSTSGGFMPPLISDGRNASTQEAVRATQALIALGILMMLPSSIKIAKEMSGAKEGFFEKYIPEIQKNLTKGWEGDKIIPGMEWSRIPGAGGLAGGTKFVKSTPGWMKDGVFMGGGKYGTRVYKGLQEKNLQSKTSSGVENTYTDAPQTSFPEGYADIPIEDLK